MSSPPRWPPAHITIPPTRWKAAAADGSHYVTSIDVDGHQLRLTATRAELNDDGHVQALPNAPAGTFDALCALDPEISYATTTLDGVADANGPYLLYGCSVTHLPWAPVRATDPNWQWEPAHDETPGSRYISAAQINTTMLHLFAHQVGATGAAFTEWADDYDAAAVLATPSPPDATPLPTAPGAAGDYVIYAYPYAR